MSTEHETFSTQRKTVTTLSAEPAISLVPVHAMMLWATSDDGKRLYKIEHAGAWDGPDGDERSGCYYEDEDIPPGAISLYRVTEVVGMKRKALAKFRRWLNGR